MRAKRECSAYCNIPPAAWPFITEENMSQAVQRGLVLGCYGFFGTRMWPALLKNPRIHLMFAGRDLTKATAAAYQLGLSANHARALDADNPDLALQLRKLGINVLIHTAGPFQGQSFE